MRSVLPIVVFCAVIFFSGCNEGQSTLGIGTGEEGGNVDYLKERASKIVRDGLGDENSYVRDRAIDVVSITGRKEFMPTVRQLLKDDIVVVRFSAAKTMGDMGYAAGEHTLRRLLNDKDENVKLAAAYSLTKLGKGNFSDVIRRAAMSKDETIRANAVMLLGKLGNKKDVKLLYRILNDSNSTDKVRIRAVEAIATLGDEKVYRSKLWPLLISKYADDRVMGIKAMAALKSTDAKNAIQTMLYDEVVEVRLYAAEELGRLGDRSGEGEVLGHLMKISRNPDEWSVANDTAVMAIGQIGGSSLSRFLPEFLASRNELIQLSAAQSVLLLTRQK
jgi:HEAT repeat protein